MISKNEQIKERNKEIRKENKRKQQVKRENKRKREVKKKNKEIRKRKQNKLKEVTKNLKTTKTNDKINKFSMRFKNKTQYNKYLKENPEYIKTDKYYSNILIAN